MVYRYSSQSAPSLAAAWLMAAAASTEAWNHHHNGGPASVGPSQQMREGLPRRTLCMAMARPCDETLAEGAAADTCRRTFLWQSAAAILVPPVAHADDESDDQEADDGKSQTLEKEDDKASSSSDKQVDSADTTEGNLAREENIVKDEKELVTELEEEEKEEEKAKADTQKLITELEEQIKDETASDSQAEGKDQIEITKELIDTLEEEEERIETKTKELIEKIETLEKESEDLQAGGDGGTSDAAAPTSSSAEDSSAQQAQEFINKLKDRVEEKEDLISRLKRESDKDIDPKTGKFKVMTNKDFKARAPSDFDFLGYLKDTLSNTDEFEKDLEAFEGLLESKFGPLVEEVRKVAKEVR